MRARVLYRSRRLQSRRPAVRVPATGAVAARARSLSLSLPLCSLTLSRSPLSALRVRLHGVLLQQTAGNDKTLNLAGALVDLGDACIAVVPLSRHVANKAHACGRST